MAYHPFKWPRTDADPSRWPAVGRQGNPDSWHDRLAPTDKKYELYERKVGDHVASKMNLPGSGHRVHLPDGYALFVHCKPQADNKIREDVYLFGTKHTVKFRSPNEFLPHVDWLLDNPDANDHSTCGCQYNKGSAAHTKRMANMGTGTKRPASGSGRESKGKKKRPSEEEDGPDGIPLERSIDLKSGRRFRRGELVWVKIDPVSPSPEAQARGLPIITHWPALCARIELKTRFEPFEPPKAPQWATSSSNGNGNGESSSAPPNYRPVQYYEYHLRALGFFDPAEEVRADVKDLLPWLVGSELLGGEAGWERLGAETHTLMKEGVTREAEADKALPAEERGILSVDTRWKRTSWAKRMSFSAMPKDDWAFMCVRAGLAIKMGLSIAQSWTQTDPVAYIDPERVNEEDRLAIQQQKKSMYQGLWWGGERIWLEDMVRLTKRREDLPLDQFPIGSGSKNSCVFMKLSVISIEVTDMDSKDGNAVSWRCVAYGDIYDLVPDTTPGELEPPLIRVQGRGVEQPIVQVHQAPKGYHYRKLNDADTEVTSDVVDIAGRVYPDLADPSTQDFYYDLDTKSKGEGTGRVKPGTWAQGIMGLVPGVEVYSYSEFWREDLYNIVSTANQSVERDTKAFYGAELAARGVPLLEPPAIAAASTGAAAAAGQGEVDAWRKGVPEGSANGAAVASQPPATLAQAQAGA